MSAAVRAGHKQTEVGVIPSDWDCVAFQSLASSVRNAIVGGPFGSDLVSADYVDDGIPVIRGQNMGGSRYLQGPYVYVSQQKARSLEANLARPGDVVFTQRGTMGQVSLVPEDPFEQYLVSQSQMKMTLKLSLATPDFVYCWFDSERGQRSIQLNTIQTGVPHINLGILKGLPIPCPSLPEQRSIATAITDVDALLAKLDALIAKKRDLKVAAMQQLLTGQTRLPGFSLSQKFKQSEIGMIPEDWNIRFLGEICQKITTGKLDANAMVTDGAYPFFTCAKEHSWISRYAFDTEALLVSGNGANVGYIHHYFGKFNAYQRTYVLTGFSENIHFTKLFMERNLQARLRTEVNAGNTPYIVMDTLAKMSVALPSNAEEQTAIATVLSDMENELSALEARRDKTRALKQGMMQELLTGHIRLI